MSAFSSARYEAKVAGWLLSRALNVRESEKQLISSSLLKNIHENRLKGAYN